MAFTLSKANLEHLHELVEQQRDEELLAAVNDLHPADIAEVLDQLHLEEAQYLFERLEPELAAEVILEVPEDRREDLLGNYTG
jgi:magnesium transporter